MQIAVDVAKPGKLEPVLQGLNVLGLLWAPFSLALACGMFLDPVTPGSAAKAAFFLLLFPAFSLAGFCKRRKRWLGAAGLALTVVLACLWPRSGDGLLTSDERAAYAAAKANDAAGLRRALARGVDPDVYDGDYGYLLDWTVIVADDPELVRLLVDAGAEVDARKDRHATPLLKAVGLYRCEAARILLGAGARLDVRYDDSALVASPPVDENKDVRQIYQRIKTARGILWQRDQACWRAFERLLDNPPPPAGPLHRFGWMLRHAFD